jgi:hypothetical protein
MFINFIEAAKIIATTYHKSPWSQFNIRSHIGDTSA